MSKYLHCWTAAEDVCADFSVPSDTLKDDEVILASYGQDNYMGDAFVLFQRDGKLFEANGSHCSCYGLEGQWEPEETTIESLRHRLRDGHLGQDSYSDNEFAAELTAELDRLFPEAPQ